MIRILWLLLIAAMVHACVRFVRGLASGLGGGSDSSTFPRDAAGRRPPPEIDEADIIEAEYTEITEPGDRHRS